MDTIAFRQVLLVIPGHIRHWQRQSQSKGACHSHWVTALWVHSNQQSYLSPTINDRRFAQLTTRIIIPAQYYSWALILQINHWRRNQTSMSREKFKVTREIWQADIKTARERKNWRWSLERQERHNSSFVKYTYTLWKPRVSERNGEIAYLAGRRALGAICQCKVLQRSRSLWDLLRTILKNWTKSLQFQEV